MEQEWEVERILERGRFNNLTYYLVKWVGYPVEEATWEPITNLDNCQHAIFQFENTIRNQPPPKKTPKRKVKKPNLDLDKIFGKDLLDELTQRPMNLPVNSEQTPSQSSAKEKQLQDS
jgi:hypothetical protein